MARGDGGIDFKVTVDMKAFEDTMRRMPRVFNRAAKNALNRTRKGVTTLKAKLVGRRYNMKARDIKARIREVPATASCLVAEVIASGDPVSLVHFDPKQQRTARGVTREEYVSKHGGMASRRRGRKRNPGVSVMVQRGRRVPVKGGFLATGSGYHGGRRWRAYDFGQPVTLSGKRGGVQVFKREGMSRLPIVKQVGPSVAGMVNSPYVRPKVRRQARIMLTKNLQSEVRRQIDRELKR